MFRTPPEDNVLRHILLVLGFATSFVGAAQAQIDPELSAYVASRRKVMDDTSRPITDRETVALEIAATLDRAAWSSNLPGTRRSAWSEARSVLDGFSSRNPGHPKSRGFTFQGAVYLWAEAQSWSRAAESGDLESRARAASAFDGAIARLQPVVKASEDSDEPLAQNARYRLARTLLDRSRLEPDRPAAPGLRSDALKVMEARPVREKNLVGFAELLHADLLADAGRFDEARAALDISAKSSSAPPIVERLAVLVSIASGRKEFSSANAEIEASNLASPEKKRLRLRLTLVERSSLEAGAERVQLEANCFRIASELKTSDAIEYAGAIRELARAIDEPAATLGPETWATLAEGAAALNQPDRAARLDVIAAAKAEGNGDLDSARRWRFRAAAISYGAGRFSRADLLFARILEDPDAGTLRPKAGMLRALSRGQGMASGEFGMTRGGYVSALTDQIRNFANDPSTGEARWLLGRFRLEDGARTEAEKLWASVPRSHARWLDSRIGLIGLLRGDFEERRLVDDPAAMSKLADTIREAIESARREAREDSEKTDLDLQSLGLDLTPGAGDPRRGYDAVDRLRALPLSADQRIRTDTLRIVALAASERFLDAEKAAGQYGGPIESRLNLARDLDKWASTIRPDRSARRIGGIERIVADRLATVTGLSPGQVAECRLRRARGRMLSGDFEGGRTILKDWSDPISELPANLADLADLFDQVGDRDRAIAAYRSLARKTRSGSPRWFAAKLGHARALASAGQLTPALQILEGTALLHSELGGPAMKEEFAALKAKLDRR